MEKPVNNSNSTAKTREGYKIAGRASDGVWIIKPSVRPTHFSQSEASASVKKVLRESGMLRGSESGRFVENAKKSNDGTFSSIVHSHLTIKTISEL